MRFNNKSLLFIFLALIIGVTTSRAGSELFPIPLGLEGHVAFWESVFTVYSTDQIIFHDSDHPERVYSALKIDTKSSSRKTIQAQIRLERNRIRTVLQQLSQNPNQKSPLEEMRSIRDLFGKHPKSAEFKQAASCIRIQGGMRESFQAGLERSGRYEEEMRCILREENVPEDLVFLPHVESSFNPLARSKAGAAGIWQFTYKTGKRYLPIRSTVDERRDPLASTRAAARLLRSNYQILKSWPLAITAYNHGPSGLKRAIRKTGSRDLGKIVQQYRNRRFGFASKNFYAEFLAARCIALNAEQHFNGLFFDPSFHVRSIMLTQPATFSQWAEKLDWPKDVLAEINPALSSKILLDRISIPTNTRLNIPLNEKAGQQIALALGTSIYWASSSAGHFGDSPAQISNAVAASVKTHVIVTVPIQNDSIWDVRFSDPSDTGSIQDLIAMASPEENNEIRSQSDEEVILSSVLQELPSFELNLTIRSGDRITVQPEETLGHYADWLRIPTWQLRKLNRMRYGQNIRLGQTVRLSFNKISEQDFHTRREAYHQEIRNHFFLTHQVSEVLAHVIRPGENFWTVANDSDNVPLWLMLAYNSSNSVSRLKPGDQLCVPVVEQKPNSG
ncbi:transglycosylase SLT domain-containing protein [candidate division KSB1 bacterium]|nr:transglycosylase SLT domain-containing protein [candidate division KSB1 bacterium]